MRAWREVDDLTSLINVFDANFVVEDDIEALSGLDPNRCEDVVEAAKRLLLPEFRGWRLQARQNAIALLRRCLDDPQESFDSVFENVSLVFDDDVRDARAFMASLLAALASEELNDASTGSAGSA